MSGPGKALESMLKSFWATGAIRLTPPPPRRNFGSSQGKGGGWRGSGRGGPQILEHDDGVRVGPKGPPKHGVDAGTDPAPNTGTAAIVPDLSMTLDRTVVPLESVPFAPLVLFRHVAALPPVCCC